MYSSSKAVRENSSARRLLDGKLCPKMNNTIAKIGGVLSNEVLPLHSKQIPVPYGLATSKYITTFGLGSELPGGLHSCCKLVIYSKADGTFLLPIKYNRFRVDCKAYK